MNYKQFTKDELLRLWQDQDCPDDVRDLAYVELESRRLATVSDRHSADDEPES